ncbi:alpha/beta hydrolase [Nocardioides lijunqiniae]|uniref:alpha/beta hydrolase n=1 Tax=Nocardioides lijunqiniae TaxID=2760832 RepID=UPI0018777918|nr:alpha/beta hydrolase [Nocardioides lijunqiniae]
MTTSRPDLDPELLALLATLPQAPALSPETLPMIRPYAVVPPETALAGSTADRREVTITSADGTSIALTVLTPSGAPSGAAAPCIYWVHGGGMVMGDRYSQIDIPLEWLVRFGAVVVSVDYRLAPEASGTTLVDDCYAGLVWTAEHAAELGVDPTRLVVAGTSAGGGLAAGTALLARDRSGPALAAQVLICPMLDHRNTSVSSHQYDGPAVWSRDANAFGWESVLGGLGDREVPAYVSPALAGDLSGLPPTYVDAGSAEVFRDEDVAYATRIWEAGGRAELHVWAGGFHGFDALFPQARVSASARQARSDWLERVLAPGGLDAGEE